MFLPEAVEVVGYENGVPVLRLTRHGGGTFTELHSDRLLYERAVHRGGGYRGTQEDEQAIIAGLDPVLPGYRLLLTHRITAVIDGSLQTLQEAIAQVDDPRAPLVEGCTLDTRPEPSLWCDEWKRLWHDAMWDAPLVWSERHEARVEPEVLAALQRVGVESVLSPELPTVTLILPGNIPFLMVIRLGRQCVHSHGKQATHFTVSADVPKDAFIGGMLSLRERIIAGDWRAQELLISACDDLRTLLDYQPRDGEEDMVGALLSLATYPADVAERLRELGGAWASHGVRPYAKGAPDTWDH